MPAIKNPFTFLLKEALHKAGYDIKKRNLASNLPSDFSPFERQVVLEVQPFTMTPPERIVSLIRAVEYVVKNRLEGDIVECGVWKGGSMMAVAKTLLHLKKTDFRLFLFDTFEGMTPPTIFDRSYTGQTADEVLQNDEQWCYAALDEVKRALFSTGYPKGNLHFIKGKVEDTIPEKAPSNISLLRLDTDFYESTCHELNHLYPRLMPKGVLIIDDYGEWMGVQKACDDFFSDKKEFPLLNRIDFSSRISVKP